MIRIIFGLSVVSLWAWQLLAKMLKTSTRLKVGKRGVNVIFLSSKAKTYLSSCSRDKKGGQQAAFSDGKTV